MTATIRTSTGSLVFEGEVSLDLEPGKPMRGKLVTDSIIDPALVHETLELTLADGRVGKIKFKYLTFGPPSEAEFYGSLYFPE